MAYGQEGHGESRFPFVRNAVGVMIISSEFSTAPLHVRYQALEDRVEEK
jgi:hypothetical protein